MHHSKNHAASTIIALKLITINNVVSNCCSLISLKVRFCKKLVLRAFYKQHYEINFLPEFNTENEKNDVYWFE